MNITEFLEARIAEDEAQAEAASVSMHGERHENQRHYSSYILSSERDSTEAQDDFILEWWPARVLAECAAKRAIISRYERFYATRRANWMNPNYAGAIEELKFVLETLATAYKDHPDYQQEWAA